MSKYNRYAKELNEAFQSAADQYNAAYQKWQEAVRKQQKGVDDVSEVYPGHKEAVRKQLEIEANEAKAEFQKVQRDSWTSFYRTRDRLTGELEKEVQKGNLANPDDVDNAAMDILNSGIANADDLEFLAERFTGNPTMLRMIGAKAADLADNEKDLVMRSKLNGITHSCMDTRPEVLDKWKNLVNVSQHYSGETSGRRDPEYILSISDHWKDDDVQEVIEDF